jgi:hypothetical protein
MVAASAVPCAGGCPSIWNSSAILRRRVRMKGREREADVPVMARGLPSEIRRALEGMGDAGLAWCRDFAMARGVEEGHGRGEL